MMLISHAKECQDLMAASLFECKKNGYSDVFHAEICFEDWYVHEDLMVNDVWKSFIYNKVKFNVPQLSQEIKNKFTQCLGEIQYNRETHCCNVGHNEINQC
jgi:hypothetical protein